MKGIAFKVTYNDGGANGGLIGYRGVCSDRNIVENVKVLKKPWCSAEKNPCRLYCDSGLNGRHPIVRQADEAHCYESRLLLAGPQRPLRFWAGASDSGKPKRVRKLQPGDIAFLTTFPPDGSGRIVSSPGAIESVASPNPLRVIVSSPTGRWTWSYPTTWRETSFSGITSHRTKTEAGHGVPVCSAT